jgi:hypothetical protein
MSNGLGYNKVASGAQIARYIRSITSDLDMYVTSWINDIVKKHTWELKTIPTKEVLKDPAFEEAWSYVETEEDLRYNEEAEDLNYEHYNQPIVLFYDGDNVTLIDGYSRTERHLWNNDETIRAYVNV